jgi:hypothetical protein
MVRSGFDT